MKNGVAAALLRWIDSETPVESRNERRIDWLRVEIRENEHRYFDLLSLHFMADGVF